MKRKKQRICSLETSLPPATKRWYSKTMEADLELQSMVKHWMKIGSAEVQDVRDFLCGLMIRTRVNRTMAVSSMIAENTASIPPNRNDGSLIYDSVNDYWSAIGNFSPAPVLTFLQRTPSLWKVNFNWLHSSTSKVFEQTDCPDETHSNPERRTSSKIVSHSKLLSFASTLWSADKSGSKRILPSRKFQGRKWFQRLTRRVVISE